jgi:oxygen-dependent protoporphyrinogen oxidase
VLGAGVTGLATAHFLRRLLPAERVGVTVVETDRHLGGKIRTETLAGQPVEAGPDVLQIRVPEAMELCRDLGLESQLVAPRALPAHLWMGGRLRPIPAGLVLGAPARLSAVAGAGILSRLGMARAALDLVLPRTSLGGDETLASVVAARFGSEVAERLVAPLLSGIYAGDAGRLSARAVAPELFALARRHRSLLLGLRRLPSRRGEPTLVTLRCGLRGLTERIRAATPGVDFRLGTAVRCVETDGPRGCLVRLDDGVLAADAVVLALPAFAAAEVLRQLRPAAAAALAGIEYASVATAALAYPAGAMPPLRSTGFLVPRGEGRFLVGCTLLTSKWPHLDGASHALVRAAVGRAGDERWRQLDDGDLIGRVHDELAEALGAKLPPPHAGRVTRWGRAMPQYAVGHLERVERIERELAGLPLVLAGAAYRGVGVASCIAQARAAALRVAGLPGMA